MSRECKPNELALARGERSRHVIAPKSRNTIARAWARLGDSRALVVGGLVLGGATIWGAAQAGIASALLYRVLRRRPQREDTVKNAASALADMSLRRVARAVIPPAPALAIRIAEVLAITYFAYRAIERRRNAQGQLATGPQPLALPPGGSSSFPAALRR